MKKVISFFLCAVMLFMLTSCGGEKEEEYFLTLDDKKIVIESLQGVSGLFVEQGGQDNVENVAAIRVTNKSEQMLEFCDIIFMVNSDGERAEFKISALPAGETAIVMESLARPYSADDVYTVSEDDTVYSYCDATPDNKDFKIKTEGSDITVKNLTDSTASATVVYRYVNDGIYYGGIAFRGKFENIEAGQSVTKTSDRFTDNCEIVNVVSE